MRTNLKRKSSTRSLSTKRYAKRPTSRKLSRSNGRTTASRTTSRSTTRTTSRTTGRTSSTLKGKRKIFHLAKKNGQWVLKAARNPRSLKSFDTKEEGLKRGRQFVRSKGLAQLVVHKADNSIQIEFTYGRDPRRFRG